MTSYASKTTAFTDLLTLASNPATKTKVVVDQKRVAKKDLVSASVDLARIATSTATVTNAMLIALNMNPRTVPTPRPAITSRPTVVVEDCDGRLVHIRVFDPETIRRGKAKDAVSANIFSFVGTDQPTLATQYFFQGATTRAKTQISFASSIPNGSTIWLIANWVNARGEIGPASLPVSFILQGSGAETPAVG
jgi:hypothetical protein